VERYICDLLWYHMPVRDQKMLIPLIMKSQRSTIFEIGFVGLPLNVDTCVEVSTARIQVVKFVILLFF
jgi:hypothetical protein